MVGLLNIHKPTGCTSRDVVNRVQKLVRPVKVGHAGTLDPLASGVLIVCLGPATRLIEYAHRLPKSYRAGFLLGRQSDTDDLEGEVVELPNAPVPSREAVEAAIGKFKGQIMQRPPAYSAVKVKGRRAYQLARRGKEIELAKKPVSIHSIGVVLYDYPELLLDIECSSGTYIRSLGRDLAEELGTAALMSALKRTAIGPFLLQDAWTMDEIDADSLPSHILSPLTLLSGMPTVTTTEDNIATLCRGMTLSAEVAAGEVAAVDELGNLVAITIADGHGTLRPKRVFLPERCN